MLLLENAYVKKIAEDRFDISGFEEYMTATQYNEQKPQIK
jgi:hypothetical protein